MNSTGTSVSVELLAISIISIGANLPSTLGGAWSTSTWRVVETVSRVMSSPLPGIFLTPARKVLVSLEANVGAAPSGTSKLKPPSSVRLPSDQY